MLIRDKCIGPGDFFNEYKKNVILSIFWGGGTATKMISKKIVFSSSIFAWRTTKGLTEMITVKPVGTIGTGRSNQG